MKRMRIFTSLLLSVFAIVLESNAQSGFQMSLPDFYNSGAIGRIGRGQINEIVYSPDGTAACSRQLNRYVAI